VKLVIVILKEIDSIAVSSAKQDTLVQQVSRDLKSLKVMFCLLSPREFSVAFSQKGY
jgi:hypothetical protein